MTSVVSPHLVPVKCLNPKEYALFWGKYICQILCNSRGALGLAEVRAGWLEFALFGLFKWFHCTELPKSRAPQLTYVFYPGMFATVYCM
ncbi:hypothetical protein J4Q44_G00196820 [Coregonus suidteri]|uniref:Uncharacterized protein n=1 Tax=Coregonus suidteri TaxID=861788 RepID=A0AAN8QSQ3_9TELE